MKETDVRDSLVKLILYLIMIYICVKMIIPIVKPVSEAAGFDYNKNNFYQVIMKKSIPSIDVTMIDYEPEEGSTDLFSIVFKYITNIDISNPKTYISSQLPILNIIDLATNVVEDDKPVVIVPRDDVAINIKPSDEKVDQPTVEPDKNNETKPTEIKPNDTKPVPAKKINPSKPLVFIYHTHTTEKYNPSQVKGDLYSEDYNINICRAGEELKKELETKYGIATLHDITIHDSPRRESGYEKARPTVDKYVKKYPSLKLIIDLHRDSDIPKNKVTAIINNQSYARVLFVVGKKNKNYKENLKTVAKLNAAINNMYPGLSKGIQYKENSRLNQDFSSNAVLIELGATTNSLDEALRTMKLIAKVIAGTL